MIDCLQNTESRLWRWALVVHCHYCIWWRWSWRLLLSHNQERLAGPSKTLIWKYVLRLETNIQRNCWRADQIRSVWLLDEVVSDDSRPWSVLVLLHPCLIQSLDSKLGITQFPHGPARDSDRPRIDRPADPWLRSTIVYSSTTQKIILNSMLPVRRVSLNWM